MTAPDPSHADLAGGRLEVTHVSKDFGNNRVLSDVTLTVEAGSTTAVVGPSGAGKTTLLRVIAGFERPDAGSVSIDGEALAGDGVWTPAFRREIGYVAQDGALFPHLSVGQNIAFGMTSDKGRPSTSAAKARVGELLTMVSLDPALAKRRPHEISGGQQQRVALARALAREPRIMLLDESFSSLDAGLRVATRRAVADVLRAARVTTILVTHDQGEALSFADQVAVMRDGVLSQVAAPVSAYQRPADLATGRFLGEAVVVDGHVDGESARCVLGDVPVEAGGPQGLVQLLLRPEQLRVADGGPIAATVLATEFYGPDVIVKLRIEGDGPTGSRDTPEPASVITIRHWDPASVAVGSRLRLRVDGRAVAFAPELADG